MSGPVEIEVLIVSLCLAQRRPTLLRAIDGIVRQEGVRAGVVIVVNGERFDPALFEEVRQRPGVRVVYQKEAFSWTELGELEAPAGDAWLRAMQIAEDVYYQRRRPTLAPNVVHFHATYVRPDWSKDRQRVARIGRHVFYR